MTLKEFAIELPALRDEAKALWGEGNLKVSEGPFKYSWKLYLVEMLMSDDPVKYLKDNSKREK